MTSWKHSISSLSQSSLQIKRLRRNSLKATELYLSSIKRTSLSKHWLLDHKKGQVNVMYSKRNEYLHNRIEQDRKEHLSQREYLAWCKYVGEAGSVEHLR